MRIQLFALAIVVAVLVVGCQQNSPVEPAAAPQSAATVNKSVPAAGEGTIAIKEIIYLNNSSDKAYEIRGTVRYAVKELSSLRSRLLEVTLTAEAVLTPLNEKYPTAKFSQKSRDVVVLEDKGRIDLEKTYVAEESNSKIFVQIKFDIQSTKVSVLQIKADNSEG